MWLCDIPSLAYEDREEVVLLVGVAFRRRFWITSTVEVPNRSETPADTFVIRKTDVDSRTLPNVVGLIHSHPPGDCVASAGDLAGLPEGWLGAVYSDGVLTSYY